MATEKGIKFYSNAYGATDAKTISTTQDGSIVFDKTSQAIYVSGVKYGGGLSNATFGDNVLKIWKVGDAEASPSISLDFSSLATTTSVMAVFNEIADQITLTTTAGQYIDSSDEKYFSSSAVESFNTDNVIVVGASGDTAQSAIGKLDNKVKTLVSEIVDNEEVTADTFANVKTSVGLNDDMSISFTNDLIKDQTSAKGAIETLATSLSEAGKVDDVQVNGETIVSNKIANLYVDGDQSSTNKIATQSTVSTAIDAIAGAGLAVDANGVVTATTQTAGDNTTNVATTAFVKTAVDNAIDGLDYNTANTANLATVSDNVITLATTIKEENGVIAVNGTQALAAVAKTGAAGDVTIADAGSKIEATTVEGALAELADAISDNDVTIKSGENVLSFTEGTKELSSTLTIAIEKQGEGDAAKEYIVLKGINNAEVSKVDASAFVKDGMIDSVAWKKDGDNDTNILLITWNTDAGKSATEVDMSKFIDTYTSGDTTALTVSGYRITPNTGAVAENAGTLTTGGQVYTAIAATKGQDIQTITGETAVTNDSYVNVAVTATKGTDDDNYTLSTTSNVTVQAVATANDGTVEGSTAAKGLAEASDVKNYVDGKVGTAIQSVGITTTEKEKNVTQDGNVNVKVTATTDDSRNVTLSTAASLNMANVKSGVIEDNGVATAQNASDIAKKEAGDAIGNIAEASKDDTDAGVKVEVKTAAGSVSGVDVAVTAATVTYTPKSEATEESEATDINLTASDTTSVLNGASIAQIKAYIDAMVAAKVAQVTNSNATIPVNNATATKIAEVDGTEINAKVSLVWEEYA